MTSFQYEYKTFRGYQDHTRDKKMKISRESLRLKVQTCGTLFSCVSMDFFPSPSIHSNARNIQSKVLSLINNDF